MYCRDDFARQLFDEAHSDNEDRFLMFGVSNQTRIFLICDREMESEDVIRIISARKTTAKEKELYEGPKP